MRGLMVAAVLAIAGCGSPAGEQSMPEPPPIALAGALLADAGSRIEHGRRAADVLGCTGCHGAELQGKRFYELYASNLTREMPKYSDAQFQRLMRDGVHPTGRDVWGMPSEIFHHLSDPDMAALIVYLRALQPAGPPTQPRLPWEPDAEKKIAEGRLMPAAQWVQKTKAATPRDLGPRHSIGRYISMVTCAECHGPDLKGNEGGAPDLIVASAYTRDEFNRLMTEGVPTGGRKLGLMTAVARDRFSRMTPDERNALYDYLKAQAEQPR
jgi:cytochrome c553